MQHHTQKHDEKPDAKYAGDKTQNDKAAQDAKAIQQNQGQVPPAEPRGEHRQSVEGVLGKGAQLTSGDARFDLRPENAIDAREPQARMTGSLADDETRAKDAILRLAQRAGAVDVQFDRTDGDLWQIRLIRGKPAATAGG